MQILTSCGRCQKARVCAVLRAVSPLLNLWGDSPPFQADQLAAICREFLEYAPFQQKGGIIHAKQLFGEQLPVILNEINQVIVS